ncbi:MAG: hypothetical protein IKA90_04950, partial [Clostridia bacterium]|nr:hypothetical protein [Clostridia bacterium]
DAKWGTVPTNITTQGQTVKPVYTMKNPTAKAEGTSEFTYGEVVKITGTVTQNYTQETGITYTYTWSYNGSEVASSASNVLTYAEKLEVGTHTFNLLVTVKDKDGQIKTVNTSKTITIKKAKLVVSAQNAERLYGDEDDYKDNITYEGLKFDDQFADVVTKYEFVEILSTARVGSYAIRFDTANSTLTNKNYEIEYKDGATLTVKQRPVTIAINSTGTYTGKNHEISLSNSNVGGNGLASGQILSGTATTSGADAKAYDKQSDFAFNFTLQNGSVVTTTNYLITYQLAYTIQQKEITSDMISVGSGLYYNGSEQYVSVTVTYNGTKLVEDEDYIILDNSNYGENAGSNYEVKIQGIGNYKDIATKGWAIAKANYDMTKVLWSTSANLTFDNSEKTAQLTGLPQGITPNYTTNGQAGNSAKDAGEYTTSVTFDYDETNYNEPVYADKVWKIEQREITVAISNTQSVYDGTTGFTADQYTVISNTKEIAGAPAGITVTKSSVKANSVAFFRMSSGVDAGSYSVSASYSNANYKITFKTAAGNTIKAEAGAEPTEVAVHTIAPKPIKVYVLNSSSTYGDSVNVSAETSSVIEENALVGEDALGLVVSKESGDSATSYAISASYSNANYVVTFYARTENEQGESVDVEIGEFDAGSEEDSVQIATHVITQKSLEITATANGEYNGGYHASGSWTIAQTGAVAGQDLTISLSAITDGANAKEYKANSKYTSDGAYGDFTDLSLSIFNGETDVLANYDVSLNVTYKIGKKALTAGMLTLTGAEDLTYNGAERTVNYTVTDNVAINGNPTNIITANDYTVTGTLSATDAGEYFVTIDATQEGNYSGSATQKWIIAKVSMADATIILTGADDLTYNGNSQTVGVVVKIGENVISPENYTVSGNVQTNAGTHTVTVTAATDSNFTEGTIKTADWTIAQKTITQTNATIVLGSQLTFNGEPQTKAVSSVTVDGLSLNSNDYTISDNNYKYAGDYTLTIAGEGNFNGSATADWSIAKAEIENVVIEENDFTYNGAQQSVTITSITANGKNWADLVVDTDYTVSDNQGTNAGDYTLTIAGKGNFAGTATANWSISPKSLENAVISFSGANGATYDGSNKQVSILSVKLSDKALVAGQDYTVDETSVLIAKDAGNHTVKIVGKGNYKDTATADWTIRPRNIANANITVANEYTYNANPQTVEFSVKDLSVLLELGTDYTIESGNQGENAGTYTLTIKGQGNYTGTAITGWTINKADFDMSDVAWAFYAQNGDVWQETVYPANGFTFDGIAKTAHLKDLPVGVKATYTSNGVVFTSVTNAGSYTVDVSLEFADESYKNNFNTPVLRQNVSATKTWNILPKTLTSDMVTLSSTNLTYNGDIQTITVTVKDGTVLLEKDTDYTVEGTLSATNAGTYKVTITPKGNYTGDAIVKTWIIDKKALANEMLTLTDVDNLTYNGAERTVGYIAEDGTVLKASDYTITGDLSATNAGTYTVTIVATQEGNYRGSVTATWAIAKVSMADATI